MSFQAVRGRVRAVLRSGWAIFGIALLFRVLAITQLLPEQADRGFYRQNEAARIGWALATGQGFSTPWEGTPVAPTAQQPPLYPWVIAMIFRLAGAYSYRSLWIAVLLNAVVSAATGVLLLGLGRAYFSEAVGVAAAWIWAGWIYAVVVSIRLWESSGSALLLAAGLLALSSAWRASEKRRGVGFGLIWGLAGLLNVSVAVVLGCLWGWNWKRRASVSFALISIVIFVGMVGPWTARNYYVFHRVIQVRDNFGLELWIGNHEGVTHLYDFRGSFPLVNPAEYVELGEIRFMETKREEALTFIRRNPAMFLRLCGQRFANFWSAPYPWTWIPLSVLAWAGAVVAVKRKAAAAHGGGRDRFLIVLVVFPLIYYITHPWSTYRHPIEPEMILLSVYCVSVILAYMGSSRRWSRFGPARRSDRENS